MQTGSSLLGRQPILNRSEELVAYELLFRSTGCGKTAQFSDASQATASVILNTLTSFGVEDILGKHQGYINLESELLMHDSLNILPKDRVVIELLESLELTPELVERCRALKENGFTLALDDHSYNPAYHELYQIVDIVKVDLVQSPIAELGPMIRELRRYPLTLLAEKVETREQFESCLELGFHLFQGYYFAKPSLLTKRRLGDSGAALLKLMRLLGEDASQQEIESVFRGEPGLTFQLLLLVNSVAIGLRTKIETVRHALAILGRHQIKRWVQLAMFASDGRGLESPLVDLAAVRAGFMEDLSGRSQFGHLKEQAFLTGIVSILDKVYDIPKDEIVAKLNLSDEITQALSGRHGRLGKLLQVAELLEELDFLHLDRHLFELDVSLDDVLLSQERAFAWRKGLV
jgi:c-di-GMP-related signal transduction protein